MRKNIRTRLAPQQSEYGSACLAMLADAYGKHISLFRAAGICSVSNDGCTFGQLRAGAEQLGFLAELAAAKAGGIPVERLPCLVTMNGQYAVLSKLTARHALLYTPDCGLVRAERAAFEESCGDMVLFVAPGDGFEPEKKASPFRFAISLITEKNLGFTLLYALILMLTSVLMLAVQRYVARITDVVFFDSILQFRQLSQADFPAQQAQEALSIGLTVTLTGMMILLLLLEAWGVSVFARFSETIAARCRRLFTWSALNLPIDLYQIRSDGYFMGSAEQTNSLSYFLSKQMVEVILRPFFAIVFLVLMASVSVPCCAVVLISVAVMVLAGFLSARSADEKGRVVFHDQSRESGFLMSGLEAIRTIRNSGSEFLFFREYARLNRESSKTLKQLTRIKRVIANTPAAISSTTKLALLLTGTYGVITGALTCGGLLLVHGIYCIVADYIRLAVHSGQDILGVKYQLENLDEIRAEAEISAEKGSNQTDPAAEYEKLLGHIRLEHVSFGYDREAGKVLDNISLDIPAGSSVAIVGTSGSGKTTLKHLICGRLHPWEGDILYDGIRAEDIPKPVLANSVASVDQQIILFPDTVMNNIKMWDPTQLDADAILAAMDAEIYDQIILR